MQTNNKLREALTKILNLTNSLDEDCAVDPVEIRDIAKAALAEPVKNCTAGVCPKMGADAIRKRSRGRRRRVTTLFECDMEVENGKENED